MNSENATHLDTVDPFVHTRNMWKSMFVGCSTRRSTFHSGSAFENLKYKD